MRGTDRWLSGCVVAVPWQGWRISNFAHAWTVRPQHHEWSQVTAITSVCRYIISRRTDAVLVGCSNALLRVRCPPGNSNCPTTLVALHAPPLPTVLFAPYTRDLRA